MKHKNSFTSENLTQKLEKQYWGTLKTYNPRQAITLDKLNGSDPREFHIYGMRLINAKMEYFLKNGKTSLPHSNILEIGCGIGRFLLPLACRFKEVHGVDVSTKILESAQDYCSSVPNVTLHENDGSSLNMFQDQSFDYVLCSGVFQHINSFEVIAQYIKEALRVLREDGLFMFIFQVWQTAEEGSGRVGAKISASRLNEAMSDLPFEIVDMTTDPKDPFPHFLVVVRRTSQEHNVDPRGKSFKDFPLREVPLRTGIFEDLESYQNLVERWQGPIKEVTFYS